MILQEQDPCWGIHMASLSVVVTVSLSLSRSGPFSEDVLRGAVGERVSFTE